MPSRVSNNTSPKSGTNSVKPDGRGGARPGAGRKPKGERAGVSHHRRPAIDAEHPALITFEARDEVPNLRSPAVHAILRDCVRQVNAHEGLAIVHYGLRQRNVLLLVEAPDNRALAIGLRSFSIRLAKAVNRHLGRQGPFFSDRFAMQLLESPRQVRQGLAFVLLGASPKKGREQLDAYTSAPSLQGWKLPAPSSVMADDEPCVAAPQSRALRSGWRRYGLLDPSEAPAPAP